MNNEFDNIGSEYGRIADNFTPEEIKSFGGNNDSREFNKTAEEQAEPKKAKKRTGSKLNLMSFIAALGAVAVIVGTVIVPNSQQDAQILWTKVTDSAIFCEIEVGETAEDLVITLTNDFTNRELPVESGKSVVTIDGLKPDMSYTISIKGTSGLYSTTIASSTVKTLAKEAMPSTPQVTHECTCNFDGLFHFTLEFEDQYGYWSDFQAEITDEDNHTAICEFTDDPHAPQSIDIISNGLIGNTAFFRIWCTTTQYSVEGEIIELYAATVKI